MKTQISVSFLKVNRESGTGSREFNCPHYRSKNQKAGSKKYFNISGSKLRVIDAKFN